MRIFYPDHYWDCDEKPEPNLHSLARQVIEDYESHTVDNKHYEIKKPPIGFVRLNETN